MLLTSPVYLNRRVPPPPASSLLHGNESAHLPIDPEQPPRDSAADDYADGVVSLLGITLQYGSNVYELMTNCFTPGGSARGRSPRVHEGGLIYKEAKTRLCQASGADGRFIRVQVEFHGHLEDTDGENRLAP